MQYQKTNKTNDVPVAWRALAFCYAKCQTIAPNVRPFVKLPAIADVTPPASLRAGRRRRHQTLAICRWTKPRKPSKAKAGLSVRNIQTAVGSCKLKPTLVFFSCSGLGFCLRALSFYWFVMIFQFVQKNNIKSPNNQR